MIYHRRESPTQSPADALEQEKTREIWGKISRYSFEPRVRAYVGPLPDGVRGVEFHTDVRPDEGSAPGYAEWTGGRPGVKLDGDIAKLAVDRVINRQPEITK
jgi:hypothetical protein